jgi:hypothetical protein
MIFNCASQFFNDTRTIVCNGFVKNNLKLDEHMNNTFYFLSDQTFAILRHFKKSRQIPFLLPD